MKEARLDLNSRIARRVRALRAASDLSLDALAAKTGVSRSMISLIERAKCSPTAVVLERLARGLGVVLASLFDTPAQDETPPSPVSRRKDQPQWKDPGSGYVRRNISPALATDSAQIVEVHFPPGARVSFENGIGKRRVHQQVWILKGKMEVIAGETVHRLSAGDCLAMHLDQTVVFHNPTRNTAHYAVVMVPNHSNAR